MTTATSGPHPPRALILTGTVFPEHLDLWRSCRDGGAHITIAGTDMDFYRGKWPWQPRRPDDLDCELLRPRSPRMSRGHVWWWYPRLGATIRRVQPDVIHVLSEPWGTFVPNALTARAMARSSAKLVVHGADNIFHHGSRLEQRIRRLALRRWLPRIDGFVSWNRDGIGLAHESGLPSSTPVEVIPAVLPDQAAFAPPSAEERRALRSRFQIPTDEVVVGFFGRLAAEKGVPDLLDALERIPENPPFLAAWGAGPLEDTVAEATRSGRVRGRFGGSLSFAEVADAMRACDIVAIPSKTIPSWAEQFGRVALEAMYAGRLVVAYRSGALPEVVAEGGVLVDEGDVGGLCDALHRFARDGSARAEMASKGRAWALNEFGPAALGQRMLEFWATVNGHGRSRRRKSS